MSGPLIALTGATGFIGRYLVAELPKRGYRVRVLLRRPAEVPEGATGAVIGDIASPHNMAAALRDVDAVIHSAGLAHAMSGMPEDDYRAINTQGDAQPRPRRRTGAREALRVPVLHPRPDRAGVGERPSRNAMSRARPTLMAARSSKPSRGWTRLAIDWVALRPVLVYGPGVKGNMAALLRLAQSPWPLPLGALQPNGRCSPSTISLSAIDAVLREPGPLRRPFIVADPEPLDVAGHRGRATRQGSVAGRV